MIPNVFSVYTPNVDAYTKLACFTRPKLRVRHPFGHAIGTDAFRLYGQHPESPRQFLPQQRTWQNVLPRMKRQYNGARAMDDIIDYAATRVELLTPCAGGPTAPETKIYKARSSLEGFGSEAITHTT